MAARSAAEVTVDVQIAVDDAGVPSRTAMAGWVRSALDAAGHDGASEVSVRVVGDAEMQELNRAYRGKDRPTNVLSFPAGDHATPPGEEVTVLGDIVICAAVVHAEAEAQAKAAAAHWAHMLVHGTLHLLGYDHEEAPEAAVMEGLETRILAAAGVADPYGAQ